MASEVFWHSMSLEDSVGVRRTSQESVYPILCPIWVQIGGFQCFSGSCDAQGMKCRKPMGEKGWRRIEYHQVPSVKTAPRPAVNRRVAQSLILFAFLDNSLRATN